MKRLLMLLITVVLTACAAVGPNYERPADSAANSQVANGPFLGASNPVFDPEPVPGDWWRLYDSPALDDLDRKSVV